MTTSITMTDLKVLHSPEIYLFNSEQRQFGANVLKDFLYYIKFTGKKGLINFSFSANEDGLHQNLSIKENYILDAVPSSLIKNSEDNFIHTSENLTNPHLKDLIARTNCIERLVKDLEREERKLVGIVKTILSNSEYIFMDSPDKFISPETLAIIKAALEYESSHNNRKVFLKAATKERWLDIVTHWISKDESGRFTKSKNQLLSKPNNQTSNVVELKKAS
ncbi:MAG: hypothetical protein CMJ16_08760 [Peredibacter sp.]|nr:hypothetical protein [Peredibacter sp.]